MLSSSTRPLSYSSNCVSPPSTSVIFINVSLYIFLKSINKFFWNFDENYDPSPQKTHTQKCTQILGVLRPPEAQQWLLVVWILSEEVVFYNISPHVSISIFAWLYLRQVLCTQYYSDKFSYCVSSAGVNFCEHILLLDYWDLIWFPVALIYFIIDYPHTGNSNLIITNSLKW